MLANEGIEKSQPDYKSLMAKVKDSGADILYFGGLVDDGGPQIAKDVKAVAPNVQFMGPDGILTQAQIDAAGADVSDGNMGTVAGKDIRTCRRRALPSTPTSKPRPDTIRIHMQSLATMR